MLYSPKSNPMRRNGVLITLILLSLLLPSSVSASGQPPDFQLLYHFALLNDAVRHDSSREIESKWSSEYGEIYVVTIPRTRNRYLLGIDSHSRVQDIAIRGTANLRNAVYDLRFLKSYSKQLGIRVHHGFEMMAKVLLENMEPYLRKDYPLRISGQSLGAAEALILAMMLEKDGYKIEKIVTFGQPKVTDKQGVKVFGSLPLVRVVDMDDVVPLLPPDSLVYDDDPYVHFGSEIVLLEGDHYCIGDNAFSNRKIPKAMLKDFSVSEVQNLLHQHSIRSYVGSIRDKLVHSVSVPCSEANRYLPPPDQLPAK